jgi:hypothetical protein
MAAARPRGNLLSAGQPGRNEGFGNSITIPWLAFYLDISAFYGTFPMRSEMPQRTSRSDSA